MVNRFISYLALVTAVCLPFATQAADPQRTAEVAKRGADVMPFDLKATTHIFTKTGTGGVQSVVAKDPGDAAQVDLVRKHLKEIQEQFSKGDFSDPSHIHGQDMPGLAQLQSAKPGQVKMAYSDVPGGAQVTYETSAPELVAALHSWFDAQLSDHGADAMAGHHHGHGAMQKP